MRIAAMAIGALMAFASPIVCVAEAQGKDHSFALPLLLFLVGMLVYAGGRLATSIKKAG